MITADEDIKLLSPEEMRVTASGQVSTSLGGETVFSLNRKETELLETKLKTTGTDPEKHLSEVLKAGQKTFRFQGTGSEWMNPFFPDATR